MGWNTIKPQARSATVMVSLLILALTSILLAAACAQDSAAVDALEARIVSVEQNVLDVKQAQATQPSVAPIEARVTAIEQAAAAATTTEAAIMRARRFEVVDEAGTARVLLTTEGGRPSVVLADQEGQIRAWLFLRDDGSPNLILINNPRFILMDQNGEIRSLYSLDQTGVPILSQVDAGGIVRATLRLDETGVPSITLLDETGAPTFTAP